MHDHLVLIALLLFLLPLLFLQHHHVQALQSSLVPHHGLNQVGHVAVSLVLLLEQRHVTVHLLMESVSFIIQLIKIEVLQPVDGDPAMIRIPASNESVDKPVQRRVLVVNSR